jgi:putative hydrolase of the HAD superfamily
LHRQGILSDEAGPTIVPLVAVEYECRVNPVWPMPGVHRLLEELRNGQRILGIVSNAQFYTPLLLRLFLGTPLEAAGFDPALCTWSYRASEAKPSANLFRSVLATLTDRYGIAPHEAIYVGNDMLNDIRPAHDLGLRTAIFAGDGRSYRPRTEDPRCDELRPDIVLTDLRQLLDVL